MPYFDRLNVASYVSPSGRSFSFSYQTVTRRSPRKIGSFEFPGVNGTLHQDKGLGGEIYPMEIFFHGPDYDLEADAFMSATKENGPGTLIHPRYGRKRVQIIRAVEQSENLVGAGGQAVFNIEFQETLEREFPFVNQSLITQIPSDADIFQIDAVANYADQITTNTLDQRNNLEQSMLVGKDLITDAFSGLNNSETFEGSITDIENNITELVSDPGGYAGLVVTAVRSVSNNDNDLDTKLLSYISLIENLTITGTKNNKLTNELIGSAAIVSMGEAINSVLANTSSIERNDTGKITFQDQGINVGFITRGDVLNSILTLRDSFIQLTFDISAAQTLERLSDMYLQTIQSYEPEARVVANVLSAGLGVSFNLPVERIKTLKKDTSLITLCYEFYKNVDESTIDFFINTNQLSGDEILTVPRSKQVVYYA